MFALLPMRSLFLTMFLSFDDDDAKRRIFKVTERVKKSFRLPFFFYPKLFVCLLFRHYSSLFFVHSGFLLLFGIIKERKNTGRFYYRHTRTRTELSLLTEELLQRERERERKKKIIMGKKEVRFVSFAIYNRRKGRV